MQAPLELLASQFLVQLVIDDVHHLTRLEMVATSLVSLVERGRCRVEVLAKAARCDHW